jgi:hypothetical protein
VGRIASQQARVECPKCKQWRITTVGNINRRDFTGLCHPCNAKQGRERKVYPAPRSSQEKE